MTPTMLFVGTKRHVVAINTETGAEIWRAKLPKTSWGQSVVALLVKDDDVYAGCGGYVFCLHRQTGEIIWRNDLGGLGHDFVTLATEGADTNQAVLAAALAAHQQAAAASSAATAG